LLWQNDKFYLLSRSNSVIRYIRIIGLFNAAIWFGMAVFFTAGVSPTFFSHKILSLFGGENSLYSRAYAGAVNVTVLEKYYYWHYICGVIAFCHLVFEWLFGGYLISRFKPSLLVLICSINLICGIFLMPPLKKFQLQKYDLKAPPTLREAASSSFKTLHLISYSLNLVVIVSTGLYFYNFTNHINEQRLVIKDKIRY